jgi:hypothetical protein
MKDYSKMSDMEINQAVACELYGCHKWSVNRVGNFYHCGFDGSQYVEVTVANYCNNPSDAWPLIESNLICLMADVFCEPQDGGKWIAQPAYGWQHERVRNDNPLRAAMIVYLMMKDEEQ